MSNEPAFRLAGSSPAASTARWAQAAQTLFTKR